MLREPRTSTRFPYTTLFRSGWRLLLSLRVYFGHRMTRRKGPNPRTPFHESLRSHHRHRLWTARAGPSVAHCRGRTAPPDKPFVGRDHARCRRSVGLGLAPAAAIAAHVRRAE